MSVFDEILFFVTFFAALSCGLIGGIFFVFSNSVMKALARISPEGGISAMQAINVTIVNPLFLTAFFGSALACLFLFIVVAFIRPPDPATASLLAGSAVYLVGSFAITVACNVPRNNALARLSASDPEATASWRDYVSSWTRWNHVRTIASLVAAVLLTYGLCQLV